MIRSHTATSKPPKARNIRQLTLFTYDLREYKQVPDWLNAKFWANPENFGKYWW